MVNYQNGKIYRIVCLVTGKVYIGSTCEPILARRLSGHVVNYKRYKKGKQNHCTSFLILENENYRIELIENYPCANKDELHTREGYWIEKTNCVNKRIAGRTNKQQYEDEKESILA